MTAAAAGSHRVSTTPRSRSERGVRLGDLDRDRVHVIAYVVARRRWEVVANLDPDALFDAPQVQRGPGHPAQPGHGRAGAPGSAAPVSHRRPRPGPGLPNTSRSSSSTTSSTTSVSSR